jgi:uncharacterized protein
MKRLTLIISVILIFAILIFLLIVKNLIFKGVKTTILTINTHKIDITIADTEASRTQGLSNVKTLPINSGMLFIFPKPGIYPFWMKEMYFPLDFVWILDHKVIDITRNVPAPVKYEDLDLPLYQSVGPVDKVLEINAGSNDKFGIKIGDTISF